MRSKALTEVIKTIQAEIKDICSTRSDSILRSIGKEVKEFSWDKIAQELERKMPTLTALLRGIVPKATKRNSLISKISCMILKQSYSRMALAQRAVSVLLYGNGASKQVIQTSIQLLHNI